MGALPALQNGYLTFGSFNNLAKATPATLSLWADVLHAVPGAKLLVKARALSCADLAQRFSQQMAAFGIGAERLLLNAWRPDVHSHLALYNDVDIALDTSPFNGATTSCEALWMGVPVISLTGQTHVSRMGASVLRSAGLADWAVPSRAAFVAKAAQQAGALPALAKLRAGLRVQLQSSALLDAAQHAQQLQSLFEQAWAQCVALAQLRAPLHSPGLHQQA